MKIKKLLIKNIRSFTDQEINFPEGSLLLSGNVGSGKTTLLLAIEYALFGLQAGQKGAALLRNSEDNGSVILTCEIDSTEVIIERGLKREKKSIVSDYAILTINGNSIEYSTTELKSKVLNLLGYPQELLKKTNMLYKYTIYTPQEQMKQIVLEDYETRLSVLRTVFGIEKYRLVKENLILVINNLKEEMKSFQMNVKLLEQETIKMQEKRERILILEKRRQEAESVIFQKRELRKLIEKEAEDIEKKIREKDQYENEVEKTSILISSKKDSLTSIEKELTELQTTLLEGPNYSAEDYISITSKIASKRELIESLHSSYLTLLSKIHSIEENKFELLEKKQRVFSMYFCPTCLQNIPEAHKHNILNETETKLVEIKKQVEGLELERKRVSLQLASEKTELENQERIRADLDIQKSKLMYIERARLKILESEKNKQLLIKDITLLEKHHFSLKEQVSNFSKFDIQSKRKLEELKHAFVEEKNAEIARAEVNKELELTHSEIARLNIDIIEKEKSKSKLTSIQEMIDWLSTQFSAMVSYIEIQVMMKLRLEFSRFFSAWFSMIVGDQFEIQLDENFTPLVIQRGIEMDYSFLSGGERTAVALAYRLALNQTINSVLSNIKTKDLIILDEPTEGFSEAQIDKIRDVLEQLKVNQLIIVSHEHKVESFVDNVIRIQKEGDISKVITEPTTTTLKYP
ncbi:MAG: AAA family ATPase [Nanoarchaeota archaeon]